MGHFLCNCIHGRRLEMIFAIIIVAQLHLSDGYQTQTSPNVVSFGSQVSPSVRYSLDVDVSIYVLLLVPIRTSGTLFAFAAVFNNTAPVTVMLWRPVQSNKYQVVWKMTVTPSSLNTTEYIFVESSFTQPCANVRDGDWVGLYSKAKPFPVARVFDANSATDQFSAPWPSDPAPELLHTVDIVTATLPYPITYLFSVFVLATVQASPGPGPDPAPASTTTTLYATSTDSWIDDGSNSTRVDWNNSSSDVPSTIIPTTTASTTTAASVSSTTLQVTNAAANAQCVRGLILPLPSPMATTTTSLPIIYGVNGSTGPVGWTGNTGPRGPQGFTGDLGLTGMASNESGETGPLGATGLTGPDGFNSTEQGVQGLNGTTGPNGEIGENGVIGLNGGTGVDGPLGKNLTIYRYKDGHYDIVDSGPSTGKNTQSPSFWQQTIAVIGIYIWLAVASFVALIAFIFLIVICCTDCILRKTVQIERRYGMLD